MSLFINGIFFFNFLFAILMAKNMLNFDRILGV